MLCDIPITEIIFGANYRTQFDENDLRDLAENMAEFGQHTPVLVRKTSQGYQLIAGERRVKAATLNAWPTIKADVQELTDEQALSITLSENMCRVQTDPIDDAKGFARLERLGWQNRRSL